MAVAVVAPGDRTGTAPPPLVNARSFCSHVPSTVYAPRQAAATETYLPPTKQSVL
jgi:hypothetical protein